LWVKLQYLDSWNSSRRRLATIYAALLSDLDIVQPMLAPYPEHIYHLYVIRVCERDALRAFLAGQGIETGIYYPIPMMFGLKL
jgi:dTDP-4-amino-4,6-dideoxygalactose transaminase